MALLTCRGGQCLLGSQTQWLWLDPASSESRLALEHPRLSRAGEALAGLCSQVLGRTGWQGVLAPAPWTPLVEDCSLRSPQLCPWMLIPT